MEKEWTLVTGAAKGLGSAICMELAKKLKPVVIHYRRSQLEAELLREKCLKLGSNAEIIQGDFSSEQSLNQFIENYLSRFTITKNLINNVGNYEIDSALNTSIAVWKKLYQSNFFSPLKLIQELMPSITVHKGVILNIGVTGVSSADVYATAYTSTKLSLWMATKSLAKELVGTGVRVNMVSPGYLENAVDLPSDLSSLPQGRAITLEETARLVAFLLEDQNSSITGQNIEIAGGVRL